MREQPDARRPQHQYGQDIDRNGAPEKLPQRFAPASKEIALRLADVQLNGGRPGLVVFHQVLHQRSDKHHRQQASRQTDKREMPAENEAHKYQRCRVQQGVTHPEGKRAAHRHALSAHTRRHRCGAAGAHHARQGENRPQQRALQARLSQGFHQPVTRDKYLNQRAQQYAQYRRFPDGKKIDHGVIPRRA